MNKKFNSHCDVYCKSEKTSTTTIYKAKERVE